ncbi:MAG: MBL fold metallo-hydrolase [Saprospiraceae bacterium]|nr:MBL fold metallo-hydrolase [Saprospiraceae bacterium]
MYFKQFGAGVTKELQSRYEQSVNWKDGKFQNLEETDMSFSFRDMIDILYKQFTNRKEREPLVDLPIESFNKAHFLQEDNLAKIIWYGHSVLLFRINGKTIFIDPMLGPDAAPIAPMTVKRFSANTLDLIDDFPEIDLMLLSHDHYDHLDYQSILRLKSKTKKYYVALGVKRHLEKWGIDRDKIQEFDWWNNQVYADIEITFTPSRHFSGRGISDRAKSLWGGWVFKTPTENIWFSGDGGYGAHFKEIGDRLGPFDFGFMECGQYNEKWSLIHMFPHESVQAALDARVKRAMPVHWGAFSLAQHPWKEPANGFIDAALKQQLQICLPKPGQLFCIRDGFADAWWEEIK